MFISSGTRRLFCAVALLLALSVAFAHAQQATATGTIEDRPSAPQTTGGWRIDGVNYTTTSVTEFDEQQAALVIGGCAEVEFVTSQSGERLATKISGRGAGSC